ncbi:MAG: PEGA domain-containing protein [Parvibaculales bacterium]
MFEINRKRYLLWRACLLLSALVVCLPTASFAKQRETLVLFPVNVSPDLIQRQKIFQAAFQQGLSKGFDVFSGAAVEDKLKVEFQKEDCSAESCAQNLAIEFNTELIANAEVTSSNDGFIVQIEINNVITGKIEKSAIQICPSCSAGSLLSLIDQMSISIAGEPSNIKSNGGTASNNFGTFKTKNLEISSIPSGAFVTIDGVPVGVTPLRTSKKYVCGKELLIILKRGENVKRLRHEACRRKDFELIAVPIGRQW